MATTKSSQPKDTLEVQAWREIGVARSRAPRKASRRNTGLAESTPSAEFEIFALVDSTSGHPRQDGPGEQSSGIMGCQGASSGKIKANFAT